MIFVASVESVASAASAVGVVWTVVDAAAAAVTAKVAAAVSAAVCETSSFSAETVSGGSAESPASDRGSELSAAGSECCAVAEAKMSVWPVAGPTAERFAGGICAVVVLSVCSSA